MPKSLPAERSTSMDKTTILDWLVRHDPLHVTPLTDPVIDSLGFDPRSAYVEHFWLGVVGPSATWAARAWPQVVDRAALRRPVGEAGSGALGAGRSGRGSRPPCLPCADASADTSPGPCVFREDPLSKGAPPPTRTIVITGARGGHGASTVAATLALFAAEEEPTTLVTHDRAEMIALLGLPGPHGDGGVDVSANLRLVGQ